MMTQLSAYGIGWIAFVAVVFCAARWGGRRGAVAAHVLVTLFVAALDVRWTVNTGLQPTQSVLGITIAIALRLTLINLVLLPVTVIGLYTRSAGSRPVT